jgi:inward rectifier potassium channel
MAKKIYSRPYEGETGFGKAVTNTNRLMHPDGRFNVERERLGIFDNLYFHLMTMPWWQFFGVMLLCFSLLNAVFASIYCLVGIEHLNGVKPGYFIDNFLNAFFFSSQTLTTVGYGHVSPGNLPASLVASIESFAGLLAFALVSGLLYGRFSRPRAKIVFSDNMLVAPYKEGRGLMFRMGNSRRSELIETEVQLILTLNQRNDAGLLERKYFALPVEVSKISFFSLSWTVVHALDEKSPLYGFTDKDLTDAYAEIMVLVKSIEEANHQTVYARHSYAAEEIVWNAKFKSVISQNAKGVPYVMTSQIGVYELL